jgi:hypothetical protein
MVAPENAAEHISGQGFITLFGQDWQFNDLWGAEAKLKSSIATAFRRPNLFNQTTA